MAESENWAEILHFVGYRYLPHSHAIPISTGVEHIVFLSCTVHCKYLIFYSKVNDLQVVKTNTIIFCHSSYKARSIAEAVTFSIPQAY